MHHRVLQADRRLLDQPAAHPPRLASPLTTVRL
jgi:hypothetical protein